jgi:hypothetical protein
MPGDPYVEQRKTRPEPAASLHCVSERPGIITNPRVSRDNGHQLRWVSEQFHSGQMHGIERADRFDWKRPPGANQDGVGHGNEVAAARKCLKSSNRRPFFSGGQTSCDTSPDDGPSRFSKRQQRGHASTGSAKRDSGCPVALQKGRQEGARFDISSGRGAAATLRHDPRRSDRLRFRAGAGCPASLRQGRRPRAPAE